MCHATNSKPCLLRSASASGCGSSKPTVTTWKISRPNWGIAPFLRYSICDGEQIQSTTFVCVVNKPSSSKSVKLYNRICFEAIEVQNPETCSFILYQVRIFLQCWGNNYLAQVYKYSSSSRPRSCSKDKTPMDPRLLSHAVISPVPLPSCLLACLLSMFFCFLASQELVLSENKIQEVPASLSHLKALRVLRLQNNRLMTLPHELGAVITLEELDCAGNADLDIVPVALHSDTAMILWVCRLHKGTRK